MATATQHTLRLATAFPLRMANPITGSMLPRETERSPHESRQQEHANTTRETTFPPAKAVFTGASHVSQIQAYRKPGSPRVRSHSLTQLQASQKRSNSQPLPLFLSVLGVLVGVQMCALGKYADTRNRFLMGRRVHVGVSPWVLPHRA